MKQLNRNYLLVVLLLLSMAFSDNAVAQITEAEYAKYWYYRHRLRTEFMVMGLSNTEAPTNRSTSYGGHYGHSLPAHNTDLVHEDDVNIWWSDGTIDLGFYISVLATEYKILRDAGYSTFETQEELYYALKAYERLDSYSHNLFDGSTESRKNGFFIRDDVTADIFHENPVFEKYKANGEYVMSSDYIGSQDNEPSGTKTITPEQFHSMLMGFALVKKCLGNTTFRGYNFKENVMTYAETTARYLEDYKWKVKNEDGDLMQYGKTFRMEGHAWVSAKAVGYISDDYSSRDFLNELSRWAILDFKTRLSVMRTRLARLPTFTVAHMAMGAAIGEGINPDKFLKTVSKSTHYIHYPLYIPVEFVDNDIYYVLYNFLRDKGGSIGDPENIDSKLRDAPCYGPMWRPRSLDRSHPYYEGVAGWRSDNRWVKASQRYSGDRRSKMNGLDYMLMYNLYILYYGQHNPELVGDLPSRTPGAFPLIYWNPLNLNASIYAYNDVRLWSETSVSKDVEIMGKISMGDGFHFKAADHSLRLIGGARNACGDVLDEFGDLTEDLESTPLFNSTSSRSLLPDEPDKSDIEADLQELRKKPNYKPLGEYLEERGVSKQKVRAYLNTEKIEDSKVTLFPNPAIDEVTISFPMLSETTSVELYDLNGRLIVSQIAEEGAVSAKMQFDAEQVQGVCFVKLSNTKSTVTKKLIIQ